MSLWLMERHFVAVGNEIEFSVLRASHAVNTLHIFQLLFYHKINPNSDIEKVKNIPNSHHHHTKANVKQRASLYQT